MTSPLPGRPGRNVHSGEFRRRRRGRNLALLAILIGLVALLFAVTTVRMGEISDGGRSGGASRSRSLK